MRLNHLLLIIAIGFTISSAHAQQNQPSGCHRSNSGSVECAPPPGCQMIDLGEGFHHVLKCTPQRPPDVQIREEMEAARREMAERRDRQKGGR
jgi:hypothetical protein